MLHFPFYLIDIYLLHCLKFSSCFFLISLWIKPEKEGIHRDPNKKNKTQLSKFCMTPSTPTNKKTNQIKTMSLSELINFPIYKIEINFQAWTQ